ncbi:pseudouridine synthase [Oceanirhabdus sp. W0125-5]|uniref:pseudouridine synthase n=1 Tax=Oceanirhabdus sp. W0125-5 TaxID=2999116 RepID=UPI0022F2D391|nr:pseudouridine synthase [Oceanirhabdus sp. W0125-5]WBW95094.1 pseudouridine synthase [Oceanirhabdus sp. W0125-5]
MERLQKYLARCGIASRRKCEVLITDGKVKVNGEVITELGFKIDPNNDEVIYNGKLIKDEEIKKYIMLNKPLNTISSAKDERGRTTVVDLINIPERIYPIGRLDYDTTGMLLLTNDGEIFNSIMHPSRKINKVYEAKIKGNPTKEEIQRFCNGVVIDGYKTANAKFEVLKSGTDYSEVRITIHEGKNRQVRKMCDAIGHKVVKLKRVSIGDLRLGKLKIGEWRELSKKELEYLRKL